jgi:hypothetical protein
VGAVGDQPGYLQRMEPVEGDEPLGPLAARRCSSENLTIRASMRRRTPLTSEFSKKWGNLWASARCRLKLF